MLLQKAGGGFPSHIHQAPLVFKPGHKPRWCWQGEKCAIPGGAWHASLWESNANSSGQGHPGVPAEGQTMLPTSLLQRQQQTRAFCWLLGVRSVTKTLVESLPEGTGCQVRAKMPPGSFYGHSCSFPSHTAVSSSLPTTMKHLTASPVSDKNAPPVWSEERHFSWLD